MNDKKKHFIAGLAVAIVVALPAYLESVNLFAGLWACLSGVIAAGVKEWCDMRTDKWDWLDFLATCLGAVIVAVFIILLHFGKG